PERGENARSATLNQPCGNGEHDTCPRYEDDDQRSDQELDGDHCNDSLYRITSFARSRHCDAERLGGLDIEHVIQPAQLSQSNAALIVLRKGMLNVAGS